MTLAELAVGGLARIESVLGDSAVSKRLMEMGVVPGVFIRVMKAAPFGDPIEVRLMGYNLALRRNEASAISVSTD
jgi:ferrous iron transport protein A